MPKKKDLPVDTSVWRSILEFNVNIDSQLTRKANFLFGASTIVLLFMLNKVFLDEWVLGMSRMPYIIMLCGSFLASFAAIMVVLPKLRVFSAKERQKEDLLYYKNVTKFYSRQEYVDTLRDLPADSKRIGEAYAHQAYSLARNVIPYKFRMIKISGWTLIGSIFLGLIWYGFSYFLT
jgi:hypothetical protein